jgi:hypothetical protein
MHEQVSSDLLPFMCALVSSISKTQQTILIFNLYSTMWAEVFFASFLIVILAADENFLSPFIRRSFSSYLQFKELTYGLEKTNASTLLRSCLEYVMNHYNHFLPGEGGYLLDLVQDVSFYCFDFYDFCQL